jgi:hypothetical protein
MPASKAAVVACLTIFCTFPAYAQTTQQQITASCNTKPTDVVTGERNDCTSDTSIITATEGNVFNKENVAGGETSGVGDKHECRLGWGDYVEVILKSGLIAPRTATLSCYALSPSGRTSGGGSCGCKYTITETKYVR